MNLLAMVLKDENGRRAQSLPPGLALTELRWHSHLRAVSLFLSCEGRMPSQHSKDIIEKKLGKWLATQRAVAKGNKGYELSAEKIEMLDNILPTWSEKKSKEDVWMNSYRSLKSSLEESMELPTRGPVASWLSVQRAAYKSGKLKASRLEMLERLRSDWLITATEKAWSHSRDELADFYEKYSRRPLQTANSPDEFRIAKWCATQRKQYSEGTLTEEQIAQLHSACPEWRDGRDDEGNWLRRCSELSDFVDTFGRWPRATLREKSFERALGVWLSNQRQSARGVGNVRLTPERIERLDAISPDWRGSARGPIREQRTWEESFAIAIEFFLEYGRWPSALAKDEKEKVSGRWITNQRQAYRGNTSYSLSAEKVEKLNAVSPDWHERPKRATKDDIWMDYANQLRSLHSLGGWPVNRLDDDESSKLAAWLSRQKTLLRRGNLSDGRRRVLDSINPGWAMRRPPEFLPQ